MCCNPFYIFLGKFRPGGFATIGALQAIHTGKNLLVNSMNGFIEMFWFFGFQSCKKLFVFLVF